MLVEVCGGAVARQSIQECVQRGVMTFIVFQNFCESTIVICSTRRETGVLHKLRDTLHTCYTLDFLFFKE